jgi:hypothetical protein
MTSDSVIASARAQMGVLNYEASGGQPPACTGESGRHAGRTGQLRWRLTANPQEYWDERYDGDDSTIWYRQECFVPELDDQFGELRELRPFDAITPQNIALVAIDDALAGIPTQTIRTNPQPEAMVAIDTWFWVEGVPSGGVTASASVPGISVTATARPGGVDYDFGDGASRECSGTGVPYSPGATSDCTHDYQRAGHYTVTSTIRWTGTYTINGAGPNPIESSVARTDSFELAVNEAQAINTGDAGDGGA